MTDLVGRQFGHYRLIRLLGHGGFADVYLGTHIHLKSLAAIKILQMRMVGSNLDQFRTEAQTLASLVHPNIVRVFDFGVQDDLPYLVMDYAPRGSLRQRYARGSIVPPQQIVSNVKQVAAALHYAHQKRLIHRDVKPENMLLGMNDEILLSDFGVVLVEQSTGSQITREAAGTLPYMAPEQLQGKPRAASDQYALGVVVYEWLCGERPFRGGPVELMGQHALTPPPLLRQRVPDIPHSVEAVVLKALSKEPQGRFADVEAFATALETACHEALAQPFQVADSPTGLQTSLNPTVPREVLPNGLTQAPTELNPSRPTIQKLDVGPLSTPIPSAGNTPTTTPDAIDRARPPFGPQTPLPGAPSSPSWMQAPTLSPPDQVRDARGMGMLASRFSEPVDYTPLSTGAVPLSGEASPSSDRPRESKNRISRRAVVASLAGVAGVSLVGGGIIWLKTMGNPKGPTVTHTHSLSPTTTSSANTSPTTITTPVGTLLYTYRGQAQAPYGVYSAVWSPDGTRIASSAGTVQIWDATDGSNVLTRHAFTNGYNNSQKIAWSFDGTRIVSIENTSMEVWTAKDGAFIAAHQSPLGWGDTVSWSPDNQRIVSGSDQQPGSAEIWNAASGQTMLTYRGHISPVLAAAWSPNGKWIASSSMGRLVHVWDATNANPIYIYGGHPVNEVRSVAWSPDSRRVASAGNDGTVHVWDASNGDHVYIYRGHFHASDQYHTVTTVAWSPDGTRIASGDWNHLVQIWDAASGNQIYTYKGHSDYIESVAWSPDGKRIASASRDGTVQVWQASS
jgi:eukaryotic-like serine/threonine-protein kinase